MRVVEAAAKVSWRRTLYRIARLGLRVCLVWGGTSLVQQYIVAARWDEVCVTLPYLTLLPFPSLPPCVCVFMRLKISPTCLNVCNVWFVKLFKTCFQTLYNLLLRDRSLSSGSLFFRTLCYRLKIDDAQQGLLAGRRWSSLVNEWFCWLARWLQNTSSSSKCLAISRMSPSDARSATFYPFTLTSRASSVRWKTLYRVREVKRTLKRVQLQVLQLFLLPRHCSGVHMCLH